MNRDDRGFTLVEVVVTMTIFSFVMVIFTGGIIQMFNTANKNESVTTAQAQSNLVFIRLDREIRYATGISDPGTLGGDPVVEYLTTNSGTATCTQLRLTATGRQLKRRQWTQGGTPGTWLPIASGVTGSQPFTLYPADPTFNFQRLRLRLTAQSGAAKTATSAETDITFTALNTSLSTSSATVCTEGRATP